MADRRSSLLTDRITDLRHAVRSLPEGDDDVLRRWRVIKDLFSRRLEPTEAVGQRRYWEHAIRDDRDLSAHMDYVHFNPVKHGYTFRPTDWPYSSFRTCVANGLYPSNWIGSNNDRANHGERSPM